MKVTDEIPEEKMTVFYQAAFEIIKDHLQEDVALGATHSLLEHFDEFDDVSKEQEKKWFVCIVIVTDEE